MLKFNELNITKDGKNLIIDASVDTSVEYSNVYIKSIIIDTQDTYISSGPSLNPLYTKSLTGQSVKNIRLILNSDTDFNLTTLNNNMFFVYVEAEGTINNNPIVNDSYTILDVVYNKYVIFNISMKYIRELECTCDIPKYFIDSILRNNALELSIKTLNYNQAIKYWNYFFKDNLNIENNNCKCYG